MVDAHRRLIRAVAELARAPVEIVADIEWPWRSITFTGARHGLTLAMSSDAAARLERALADDALRIPGHHLADIGIAGREPRGRGVLLYLTALTVIAH